MTKSVHNALLLYHIVTCQIFGLFELRYFMDDPRFSQSSFMTPFIDTGWVIINWFLEMGYV